jgi:nicotinamide riboside transporter PnuC
VQKSGEKYKMWKTTITNLFIALLLLTGLFVLICFLKIEIVFDNVLFFSILSTITGVCYILTIRNPEYYTGFYFGIVSSACLGVQMALLGNLDQTLLYLAVFVPCQTSSLINWRKKYFTKTGKEKFVPEFSPFKMQMLYLLIFIVLTVADFVFMSKFLPKYNSLDFWAKVGEKSVFAVMVSSSILANFLLIGKRMETWLCWVIYSGLAVISAVIVKNSFNLLLFIFFLVINTLCFISWLQLRKTAKT